MSAALNERIPVAVTICTDGSAPTVVQGFQSTILALAQSNGGVPHSNVLPVGGQRQLIEDAFGTAGKITINLLQFSTEAGATEFIAGFNASKPRPSLSLAASAKIGNGLY